MPVKKMRIVSKISGTVPRIPGVIAYAELMERIIDNGVVLDGGSKMTAMGHVDKSHLLAKASQNDLPLASDAGTSGPGLRRRGAPLARRNG